jgi:hypothetical protein
VSQKLGTDESPFIHLTTNPKYIDVLCVNCYECVTFKNVNSHSKTCAGKGHKDETYNLDIERDLKKLVAKGKEDETQDEESDVNEKIFKLMKAIK